MKKEKKDKHFIKKPTFPGGRDALRKFIKSNLKYPQEALKNKVEGTVRLKLEINYKGIVKNTSVITKIGSGCDEEAERICEMMKFEVPHHRGVRVTFFKNLNIRFKLPPNRIVYKLKKSKEKPEIKKGGYSYTINLGL